MEISGASTLRRSPIFTAGRGRGFIDEGYLRYYVSPVRCGGRKKEEKRVLRVAGEVRGRKEEEKRRAKIVKELSKDLSAFFSIGFGVEAGGAAADLKGNKMTISPSSSRGCTDSRRWRSTSAAGTWMRSCGGTAPASSPPPTTTAFASARRLTTSRCTSPPPSTGLTSRTENHFCASVQNPSPELSQPSYTSR